MDKVPMAAFAPSVHKSCSFKFLYAIPSLWAASRLPRIIAQENKFFSLNQKINPAFIIGAFTMNQEQILNSTPYDSR
jgi:hypothetical protein